MTTIPTTPDTAEPPAQQRGSRTAPPEGTVPHMTTGPKDNPLRLWNGKATLADKALLSAILGTFVVLLALWPARPYLIASHPILLEFLTGSKAAIGAAAAYARIGEAPLALVVVAGAVGMAKLDWLFWWAGGQWGQRVVRLLTPGDRAQRFADTLQRVRPWVVGLAVVLAVLPGVPKMLVYILAGMTGMRLRTFLVLDVLGALAMTGLVAGLGYALGQHAVDAVVAIEDKAIWVSLGIVVVMALLPALRKGRRRARS